MQDAKIAVKKNKFFGKFVLMVLVTTCVVILFSSIITQGQAGKIPHAGKQDDA